MTTERSPRKRAADGRRAELVQAAARVVSRDGVAAATTRRIAEEAGLPQGLVHYWFASKDELIQEVVTSLLTQFEAAAAPAVADVEDPAGYVLSAFRAAFGVVEADDPGRQLATYELTTWALRTPRLRDVARQQYAAYRQTAAAIVAPWLAAHGQDFPASAAALAQFVAVLFDGAVLAWLADPEGTRPDEIFALAADLLARAASPSPGPPSPGPPSPGPSAPRPPDGRTPETAR
jgi:DNA-binding transcriptional regulator YbjK